jgi:hypothetical protein
MPRSKNVGSRPRPAQEGPEGRQGGFSGRSKLYKTALQTQQRAGAVSLTSTAPQEA